MQKFVYVLFEERDLRKCVNGCGSDAGYKKGILGIYHSEEQANKEKAKYESRINDAECEEGCDNYGYDDYGYDFPSYSVEAWTVE